jgi:hypothetical protein
VEGIVRPDRGPLDSHGGVDRRLHVLRASPVIFMVVLPPPAQAETAKTNPTRSDFLEEPDGGPRTARSYWSIKLKAWTDNEQSPDHGPGQRGLPSLGANDTARSRRSPNNLSWPWIVVPEKRAECSLLWQLSQRTFRHTGAAALNPANSDAVAPLHWMRRLPCGPSTSIRHSPIPPAPAPATPRARRVVRPAVRLSGSPGSTLPLAA